MSVQHLISRLIDRGMPAIRVRVIIFVYQEQYTWVEWDSVRSNRLSIVNGTRKGSILSPALFALYVDELLKELRKLDKGCKVANLHIYGCFWGF